MGIPILVRRHLYIETPNTRENWVWNLSHPPLNPQSPASFDKVTRLPPENTCASLGHSDAWWPNITVSQASPMKCLFACQKSRRSISCNMVKSGLTWSRVFRHHHLGRRVTAITYLRWPTVICRMMLAHLGRNGWRRGCTTPGRTALIMR